MPLFTSKRKIIAPPLPVDYWCQLSPEFVFGVPFGWTDFNESQFAEWWQRNGRRPLAGVYVERLGPLSTVVTMDRPVDQAVNKKQFSVQAPQASRELPEGMRLVQNPVSRVVGGAPAFISRAEGLEAGEEYGMTGPVVRATTVALALNRNWIYSISMIGPADQHQAYLPALDTMLGTWRWA